MVRWLDFGGYGFQLRGAVRPGEERRVVVVPAQGTLAGFSLRAEVAECLYELGFERSGPLLHRVASGLQVQALRQLFPEATSVEVAPDALFSAPWPLDPPEIVRIAAERARLAADVGEYLALAAAVGAAIAREGEDPAAAWARWMVREGAESLASAPTTSVVQWMESQLPRQAVLRVGDAAAGGPAWPELDVAGFEAEATSVREAWRAQIRVIDAQLALDALRIGDVERITGLTQRTQDARGVVALSVEAGEGVRADVEDTLAERVMGSAVGPLVLDRVDGWERPRRGSDLPASTLARDAGIVAETPGRPVSFGGAMGVAATAFAVRIPENEGDERSLSEVPIADVPPIELGPEWLDRDALEYPVEWVADRAFTGADEGRYRAVIGRMALPGSALFAVGDVRYRDLIERAWPEGRWFGKYRRDGVTTFRYRTDEGVLLGSFASMRAPIDWDLDAVGPLLVLRNELSDGALMGARERLARPRPEVARAADGGVFRERLEVAAPDLPETQGGVLLDDGRVRAVGYVPTAVGGLSTSGSFDDHDGLARRAWGALVAADPDGSGDILDGDTESVALLCPEGTLVAGPFGSNAALREALAAEFVPILRGLQGTPALPRWELYLEQDADRLRLWVPATPARRMAYGLPADAAGVWLASDTFAWAGPWTAVGTTVAGPEAQPGLVRLDGIQDPLVAARLARRDAGAEGDTPEEGESEADAPAGESSPPAKRKRSASKGKSGASTRSIDDFGEKIGGARKDIAGLRGRALSVAMTAAWSEEEVREHLTRDSLWPFSIAARRAAGVDWSVIYVEQQVRNSVRPSYSQTGVARRRYPWSAERARQWGEQVAMIRDWFDGVKTVEQLVVRSKQVFVSETDERGWDAAAGAWKATRRLNIGGFDQLWSAPGRIGEYIAKRGAELAAAEAAKATKADSDSAPRRELAPRVEARPHLAALKRTGPERREGGADVSVEDFATTFGFRGGEFGNWLSDDERQSVLNLSYDALSDLADVLKVPPRAVSLGGELAIAFGARGRGGRKSAAAHYEPGRRVVNLTRINGAGSLAHEFGHALDHYVGYAMARIHSLASSKAPYSRASLGNLREEVAAPFVKVIEAIWYRSPSVEEELSPLRIDFDAKVKRYTDFVEHLRNRDVKAPAGSDGWEERLCAPGTDGLRSVLESAAGAVSSAWCRLLDASSSLVPQLSMAPLSGDETWVSVCDEVHAAAKEFDEAAKGLKAALRSVDTEWYGLGAVANTTYGIHLHVTSLAASVGAAREIRSRRERTYTASFFRRDAERIDAYEERKSAYWAEDVELFARAFECYVYDRLRDQGRVSDYLVHGVADRPLDPVGEASLSSEERKTQPLYAYPRGDERAAINAAFDELFEAIKHEATADGHVRLYQRRGASRFGGMSVEAVEAAAAPLAEALGSRYRIFVVPTVDDLPFSGPADVAGLFTAPRAVWLVAENLDTSAEVEATLIHEVLRHGGLFRLLGDRRTEVLDGIWADNPTVRHRADALRLEAAAQGFRLSRQEATEEALAQLADSGALAELGMLARIGAVVRSVLRRVGLGALAGRWTDVDVAYLMSSAARASGLAESPGECAGGFARRAARLVEGLAAPGLRAASLAVGAALGAWIANAVFDAPAEMHRDAQAALQLESAPARALMGWQAECAAEIRAVAGDAGGAFGRAEMAIATEAAVNRFRELSERLAQTQSVSLVLSQPGDRAELEEAHARQRAALVDAIATDLRREVAQRLGAQGLPLCASVEEGEASLPRVAAPAL